MARKGWGLDFHLPFKGTPPVTYFPSLGSASYYYLVIVLWSEDPAGQAFEKHPRTEPLQHVIFISDLVTVSSFSSWALDVFFFFFGVISCGFFLSLLRLIKRNPMQQLFLSRGAY